MPSTTPELAVHRRKRVRFTSDESSKPSIPNESALTSTSVIEGSTDDANHESDSESELSESSEEPSDDSSSEDESDEGDDDKDTLDTGGDEVINLRANRGKKPIMKLDKEELGPDIRTFLKDFLPRLKAANEELEAQKKAGKLKTLDAAEDEDGEPYIEMVGEHIQAQINASAEIHLESRTRSTRSERPKRKRKLRQRTRRRRRRRRKGDRQTREAYGP